MTRIGLSRLRVAAITAVVAGLLVVAYLVLRAGGPEYSVWLTLDNASQLIVGNDIRMGGTPVGRIRAIRLRSDGRVAVKASIDDARYQPLREGARAVVRAKSLSGVASRYIELQPPGVAAQGPAIPSGGQIPLTRTTSTVEFDALFGTFDPPTRAALRSVIKGFGATFGDKAAAARRGWLYLNPSLAATDRLFRELNRDTPRLRAFVSSTSRLFSDLAARRSSLTDLVDEAASMMNATARQRQGVADSIAAFPPFLRSANTTFVNLRTVLDEARPLMREGRPVARKLSALMARLRPLSVNARPAMRQLAALLRQPGTDNDLVELTRSAVPLRQIGVGPVSRNGRERAGALPASVAALRQLVPQLKLLRPYTVDFAAIFDYFGHGFTGDALRSSIVGGAAFTDIPTLAEGPPGLQQQTITGNGHSMITNQRNRCPLALERDLAWKPTPDFPCDITQVPPGR